MNKIFEYGPVGGWEVWRGDWYSFIYRLIEDINYVTINLYILDHPVEAVLPDFLQQFSLEFQWQGHDSDPISIRPIEHYIWVL